MRPKYKLQHYNMPKKETVKAEEIAQWQQAENETRAKLPRGVKLIRTLRGHTDQICDIEWSPNGALIATSSSDGDIRLWNFKTGDCVRVLSGHKGGTTELAFEARGKVLASGSWDQTIRLWDVDKGLLLQKLVGHEDGVFSIAINSRDGILASASLDSTIKLWELNTGRLLRTIRDVGGFINCIRFEPSGQSLICGGNEGRISVLDVNSGRIVRHFDGHTDAIATIAIEPEGETVASSSDDRTVRIWELSTGRSLRTLEGHTSRVNGVAYRHNGSLVASVDFEGVVRLWNTNTGDCIAMIQTSMSKPIVAGLAFHPNKPLIAFSLIEGGVSEGLGENVIIICALDLDVLLGQAAATVTYTSAKIVIVGESNVGKSYLAHRIATGKPPETGAIESTHGMKFWPMQPPSNAVSGLAHCPKSPFIAKLFGSSTEIGDNNRRDVVLWDMGGQEEYRLIHQLFLHDTTVALILLDPTRGAAAYREVEAWNKSLEKQLRGRAAVKLLVGAKVDKPADIIDHQRLEKLCKECGFAEYCETSALTGRGIDELCEAVARAIDWDRLGKTSRPELFQRIRDEIEARRKGGEVVLRVSVLERSLLQQDAELQTVLNAAVQSLVSQNVVKLSDRELRLHMRPSTRLALPKATGRAAEIVRRVYDCIDACFFRRDFQVKIDELSHSVISKDVAAVTEQLATQGVIARSRFSTGTPVLVLQVQEIERYAGSLILAARKNPRGVPALELSALAHAKFSLPGISKKNRLPREQEKPVIECTVQLMLEHGICFQHEGLLIFPSLFVATVEASDERLSHAISLYYDFAGAIDNIYASLVASLVLAKEFGKVRLWSDRAEFEVKSRGLCGLRKVGRPGGFAHVDLYFEAETPERQRKEFVSFVEDHLVRYGVEIREHVAISCACGHEFAEETLRQRIARSEKDVLCPVCESRHSLTEGAAMVREQDPKIQHHTWVLRTQLEKLREKVTMEVVQGLAKAEEILPTSAPIRILHLSDLHFTRETPVIARLQWLLDDLKRSGGLGVEHLDYLVVSGDFTDKGVKEGFEKAYEFVSLLTQSFGLSAERCIFVPGNHDVSDIHEAYEWRETTEGLDNGEWLKQGEIYLVRDNKKYPLRLKAFDSFYHKFLQKPYPLDFAAQGFAIPFWETGLQFIALNSCWQIDQFNRKRSGVNVEAIANALIESRILE